MTFSKSVYKILILYQSFLRRAFFYFLKKRLSLFTLIALIYSPFSMGAVGSITDLSYSSEETLEESFFGALKGSFKAKLSRNLRRGNWEDFFSKSKTNSLFDSLLIRTDLSFNYPLSEVFSLSESSRLKELSLFLTLSYKRPVYDVPQVIKQYCYQLYFCFGEISLGASDSLPEKLKLKGQYSVYLTIPITSKNSFDAMKYLGLGAFLQVAHPIFSKKSFSAKGVFSHFFDTGIYASRYANEAGSKNNNVFSAFNQLGLIFSIKKQPLLPQIYLYFSHHAVMDYNRDFFQLLSLSGSAVWAVNKRLKALAGLSWGGDIFQHEFSNQATDLDFFNADETSINGGLSYSF